MPEQVIQVSQEAFETLVRDFVARLEHMETVFLPVARSYRGDSIETNPLNQRTTRSSIRARRHHSQHDLDTAADFFVSALPELLSDARKLRSDFEALKQNKIARTMPSHEEVTTTAEAHGSLDDMGLPSRRCLEDIPVPEEASISNHDSVPGSGTTPEAAPDDTDTQLTSPEAHDCSGTVDSSGTTSTLITTPDVDAVAVLRPEDMGEMLVPTLMELLSLPKFRGRVRVDGPALDTEEIDIARSEGDHYTVILSASGQGVAAVQVDDDKSQFDWPDFSSIPARPSDIEIREFMTKVIDAPPEGSINYYGGGAACPLGDLLHPGEVLSRCEDLRVANSTFYHIGDASSCTAFHCEDAEFFSCNVTDVGYKTWVLISPDCTGAFEEFLRFNFTGGECDQFVRHQGLLVAPWRLDKEGIRYDIQCTGPGDMIVTQPRQYHAVVNYSACVARSINFLPPGQPLIPEGYHFCERDGLYNLRHRDPEGSPHKVQPPSQKLAGKRKGSSVSSIRNSGPLKKRFHGDPSLDKAFIDAKEIKDALLQRDPGIEFPSIDPFPSKRVARLAAPILGSACPSRLATLRESLDDEKTPVLIRPDEHGVDNGADGRLLQAHMEYLRNTVRQTESQKCRLRVAQYRIAKYVEERKGYRIRAASSDIDQIVKMQWPADQYEEGKRSTARHLAQGRKWMSLCGSLPGLLALIPLNGDNVFGVTEKEYLALEDGDIEDFWRMFEGEKGKERLILGKELVSMISYGNTSCS